jgi:hypothetical protein
MKNFRKHKSVFHSHAGPDTPIWAAGMGGVSGYTNEAASIRWRRIFVHIEDPHLTISSGNNLAISAICGFNPATLRSTSSRVAGVVILSAFGNPIHHEQKWRYSRACHS